MCTGRSFVVVRTCTGVLRWPPVRFVGHNRTLWCSVLILRLLALPHPPVTGLVDAEQRVP